MKRLKEMKQQNKWMLVVAVSMICVVAGFNRLGQVTAATEEEVDGLDYLDPFTLQVMSMDQNPTPATSSIVEPSDIIVPGSVWDYYQPLKIWIPERPIFRSPCTPSWW